MLRRKRAFDGLDDEIRAHIESEIQENIERGLPADEARRRAMLRFGNVARIKEDVRAVWIRPLVDEVRQDVQYALRMVRRNPSFALVVVLTLALGVGANAAMFTVVNAVLLRPLPYHQADRLVRLTEIDPRVDPQTAGPRRSSSISVTELLALHDSLASISQLSFVAGPALMTASGWGTTTRLQGLRVAPNYFETLGVSPYRGRALGPSEEAPGSDGVIVLSHATWQTHFEGANDVVGRSITLANSLTPNPSGESTSYLIIGVMPAGFDEVNPQSQFWIPAQWNPKSGGSMIARLADGYSMAAAEAELGSRLRTIRGASPEVRYELAPALDHVVEPIKTALLVLASAATFVLLIACVNVANLFLARVGERQREIAIRTALGAGRVRLIRQLLMEGILLALIAGVAGTVLAWSAVAALRSLATTLSRVDLGIQLAFPRLEEIAVDGTVLAFIVVTSIAAGVVFSIGPAIRYSRAGRGADVLREAASTAHSGFGLFRRGRTRALLVLAEVALAMVLLVGAGLMIHSFMKLGTVDPGYEASNVLTFQVALPADQYPLDRLKAFSESLVTQLGQAPDIVWAAYGQPPMVVLRESALFRRVAAVPAKFDPGGPEIRLVSRDYLKVIGIAVVAGRDFEGDDGEGTARVLLINETFAKAEFASRNPVGSHAFVGPDSISWEIVGVVRDVRQLGFDQPPGPQIFALVNQWPGNNAFPLGPYFSVRTRSDPLATVRQVRAAVISLDREAGLFNIATMESIVANALSRPRLYAALLGTFGAVAGALALIGIYGVISYAVSQRTREIGVRMALGARARDVLRLVLAHSLVVTSCGVAAGLAGAVLLSGYMRGMLFGVEPLDVVTFTAVTACFIATAAAASYIPARRATKVDPLRALRWE